MLDEIYDLIKEKVKNATPKYDDIIKEKSKIINTISLNKGLLPGIIFTSLLLIIPPLRNIL